MTQPALLGVPWDEKSSFLRGCAQAPPLIRQALYSASSNLWSETGVDFGGESPFFDAGDVDLSSGDPLERIQNAVSRLLGDGLKPLILGGDHAVTYPVMRAFARRYPGLNILHFDAHPDLYDELDGDRHSHACPFARILEEGLAKRVVQLGIRTANGHQKEQARRFGVEQIEMRHLTDSLAFQFDAPLYISLDLDALDPAFAPGVSHFEPGGMSVRRLIDLVQSVKAPCFAGADLVEFNPSRDPSGMTAMVCGKLVKELGARLMGGQSD